MEEDNKARGADKPEESSERRRKKEQRDTNDEESDEELTPCYDLAADVELLRSYCSQVVWYGIKSQIISLELHGIGKVTCTDRIY